MRSSKHQTSLVERSLVERGAKLLGHIQPSENSVQGHSSPAGTSCSNQVLFLKYICQDQNREGALP